jgi:NTP pyrophosphatase (non-canonical NTP hydrolase)
MMVGFEDIINHFGVNRQSRQAMEECGELIQAINKMLRYPDDEVKRIELIEEIADVLIMIVQLKIIFDIEQSEIRRMMNYKKSRLVQRYKLDLLQKNDGTRSDRTE